MERPFLRPSTFSYFGVKDTRCRDAVELSGKQVRLRDRCSKVNGPVREEETVGILECLRIVLSSQLRTRELTLEGLDSIRSNTSLPSLIYL